MQDMRQSLTAWMEWKVKEWQKHDPNLTHLKRYLNKQKLAKGVKNARVQVARV